MLNALKSLVSFAIHTSHQIVLKRNIPWNSFDSCSLWKITLYSVHSIDKTFVNFELMNDLHAIAWQIPNVSDSVDKHHSIEYAEHTNTLDLRELFLVECPETIDSINLI